MRARWWVMGRGWWVLGFGLGFVRARMVMGGD